MKLRHSLLIALMGLLIFQSTLQAEDDPRFQDAQRTVPWEPVYPIGDEQSCHNPRPHQTGVFHSESVRIGREERIFRVVVPANYDRNRPVGILMGFQGFHEAEVNYLWSAGFEDYNESAYWISVSMAMRSFTGYDNAVQDESKNQDLQFFQYVLGELRSHYTIDEDRIFATGFSNGANFIQFLGFVYPKLFAAINPNMGCVDVEPRPKATYACIAAGGLRDTQYHSTDFNRKVYAHFQRQGLEMQCHEFDNDHFWPPPDTTFDPPKHWTETVVDFFMTHPRGFGSGAHEPLSLGHVFADDFDQNNGMDGQYWHTERFLDDGVLCEGKTCDLKPDGGYLMERSTTQAPHGILCLTDFIPRPATWRIIFTLNTLGEQDALYPVALRDSSGRTLFLSLGSDAWRWQMAATENDFRCSDGKKLTALAQGPFTPEAGCAYELILEHQSSIQWRLLGDGIELASGLIDQENPLGRDCRFGFGVRGNGSSVAFDRVALTQEAVDTPKLCNNLLTDYFTSFGQL